MLRRWFEDEDLDGPALSAYLIKQIIASGLEPLEPVEPPQSLPPISSDETSNSSAGSELTVVRSSGSR